MTFPRLLRVFNARADVRIQSNLLYLQDHVASHLRLGMKGKYFYFVAVKSDSGIVLQGEKMSSYLQMEAVVWRPLWRKSLVLLEGVK